MKGGIILKSAIFRRGCGGRARKDHFSGGKQTLGTDVFPDGGAGCPLEYAVDLRLADVKLPADAGKGNVGKQVLLYGADKLARDACVVGIFLCGRQAFELNGNAYQHAEKGGNNIQLAQGTIFKRFWPDSISVIGHLSAGIHSIQREGNDTSGRGFDGTSFYDGARTNISWME